MTDDAPLSPRVQPNPASFRAPMLRRFGWLYHLMGFSAVMDRVRIEEHSVERLRRVSERGPMVYVLLYRSTIDLLAFNTVLNRRRLPRALWTNGRSTFYWQPIKDAWQGVFHRIGRAFSARRYPDALASGWLKEAVMDRDPIAIFLKRNPADNVPPEDKDPLRAVFEAQQEMKAPVQLVPVVILWNRSSDTETSGNPVRDFLLGSMERPSLWRKLYKLYVPTATKPILQIGEPLDIRSYMERVEGPKQLTYLRRMMRRYLRRESRTVQGPALLPRRVLKKLVLANPPMRERAQEIADTTGRSLGNVLHKMEKEFDLIAANFSWPIVNFLRRITTVLWTRVYQGYDIREEDLDRIRHTMRQGAVILAPTHKSHFDYLLMSWLLYHADLMIPHVVAGVNLAIWPVSILLRGAGAFFIKRSFQGQEVHAAVYERYLRELLRHRYPVEFFVEGGRTRTGLLLRPKLGVLQMIAEATANSAPHQRNVLLPMNVSYERVAEEGVYATELSGAEKEKESVGQLIKARKVLNSRFGKVYVRVADGIDVGHWLESLPGPWDDLPEADRREHLRTLGERLVHAMGTQAVVMPTTLLALTLLSHDRSAITTDGIRIRALHLQQFLDHKSALFARPLHEAWEQTLHEALDKYAAEGLLKRFDGPEGRIWSVVDEKRVIMDYQKNQVMQFFMPASLVSRAIQNQGDGLIVADALTDDVDFLLRTFSRDVVRHPDETAADLVAEGLVDLVAFGALEAADDGAYRVTDEERLRELGRMISFLMQAYRLTAEEASTLLADKPMELKAFSKSVLSRSSEYLSSHRISRPEALGSSYLSNAAKTLLAIGALREESDKLRPIEPALSEFAARLRALGGGWPAR